MLIVKAVGAAWMKLFIGLLRLNRRKSIFGSSYSLAARARNQRGVGIHK